MNHFCTYFDRNYLARGLTLYRSLRQHAQPFLLYVLCLDDTTLQVLQGLDSPDLLPIALSQFERGDDELLAAKANRGTVEYYFTCTPSLPLYLLSRHPSVDLITYLDADLFFYSDPRPIFDELGEQSILIVEHRFPPRLRHLDIHGSYNVGLMSFRNDRSGRQCLDWWRARCLEWCCDRPEDGRFADQKYLDDWPARFSNVVVLQHEGAGLAPWNFMNYDIRLDRGCATIDGQPLIFYHFHRLRILNGRLYDPGLSEYGQMPKAFRDWLYGGYLRALRNTRSWLQLTRMDAGAPSSNLRDKVPSWRWLAKAFLKREILVAR